ncbi:MAG TPA: Na+/H+ antiporter subunit E [Burkholderiales bacterium]|nr:Na+/H+ antiporter subunit E [Burkholderiales bacterium]
MKRWLPFPLLWALLIAMWLLLNETLAAGQVMLGALLAFGAVHALAALQAPEGAVRRRPVVIAQLAWLMLVDIVRSNLAMAQLVLHRGTRRQTSAFVTIDLELRHPGGLAVFACIFTATPGTAWVRYDGARNQITIHVLDLIDQDAWIEMVKQRYERRLLEIFE